MDNSIHFVSYFMNEKSTVRKKETDKMSKKYYFGKHETRLHHDNEAEKFGDGGVHLQFP
jgi:hypothetical protein